MRLLIFFLIFVTLSPLKAVFAQSPRHIVILGDSITDGYGVDKDNAFPAVLEKMLLESGKSVKVVNAGISGSTSASAVSRMKWILKNPPHLIVLALGGNDGLRGFDPEVTKKNLSQAIELAKKQKVKIVIAGMQMPVNYGRSYREKFKQIFPDLAKQHSIPMIPFLLEGVGGEKELNLSDGIHPNEAGHRVIAKTVYNTIKGLIE